MAETIDTKPAFRDGFQRCRCRCGTARRFLLARSLPPKEIFLSTCLFAVVAAVATGLLALRGTGAAAVPSQS